MTLNVRLADQFGLAVVRLIAPMTFSPAGLSFVLTGYSEQPSSEADADPTHEHQKSNCENAVHLTSLSHSNHFAKCGARMAVGAMIGTRASVIKMKLI
jgi:hypothetical protein